MTLTMAVSSEQLQKRYGDVQALNGVNFSAKTGEFVALIGANGAGKTTLLSILMGLLPASGGTASVLGTEPGSLASRQASGAMLQSTSLPDALKVGELMELFRSYYPAPMAAQELADVTGVSDLLDRRYKRLSGGQQRRVQFALALAGNPKLLFLDEPTVGLDMSMRREFWSLLQRLKEQGVTVILTSHYLDEIDLLADRLVVIQGGRIIADDLTDNIKKRVEHKNIVCQTRLSEQFLHGLEGVLGVTRVGRLTTVATQMENMVLARMLSEDPDLSDLLVESSSLEDAINAMVDDAEETQP